MKEEIREKSIKSEEVPALYLYCMKEGCPQAVHCLRRLAVEVIGNDKRAVQVLTPSSVRTDGHCPEFKSDAPVRMAYGWGKLYDRMPYRTALSIKAELMNHFGKTEYYRKGRQEKPLTPDEQEYVRSLFNQHNLKEEPEYERYEEELLW